MLSKQQFQEHIGRVLNDKNTPQKEVKNNRLVYWDEELGAIIITHQYNTNLNTIFWPKGGRQAFDEFK